MEKLMDMHVHSSYSDGDHTPNELIDIARKKRISTISITDHDNVLAYANLKIDKKVSVIPGIELSANDNVGRMHILGYGIDPNNNSLLEATANLRENSIDSFLLIVEYLASKGIIFASKDISLLINKEGDVGRPDLAKLCIEYGYSETVEEAFEKYLIEAYEKTKYMRKRLDYQECFELIKNAGGIPVLAHPISLKRDNEALEKLVEEMVANGLMGIEIFHSHHSYDDMLQYLYLMRKYKLLYSAGSDYHGEITKPDIEMARGRQRMLRITGCSVADYVKNR